MCFEFPLLAHVCVYDQNRFGRCQFIPDKGPTTANRGSATVLAIVLALPCPFSLLDNVGSCGSSGGGFVLIKKRGRFPALNFSGGPTVQIFRAVIPKFDAIFHIANHDCVVRKI